MQLWTIGIEGAGEELAPKGAKFDKVARPVAACDPWGGQGVRGDGRHDESCLLAGDFCRAERALLDADRQFRTLIIKTRFQLSVSLPKW
jgi:hypothetical protein